MLTTELAQNNYKKNYRNKRTHGHAHTHITTQYSCQRKIGYMAEI